jgi:tetratricopeptide (TPR) repeat protein
MTWKLIILLLLVVPAFSSEEKDEKKALEAQAKELVQQAKDLEKSGQLVAARKRYATSQAFWETKDAAKAIKHIDDEINKQIKDALKQAHQLYDQGRFKQAIEVLENALQLNSAGAVLSYDLALCHRGMGDSASSLAYLDQAVLGTADPKRSAKLKQLRTAWVTGEQAAAVKDVEKDHINYVNRLMESIGFEASVADEMPSMSAESADPAAPVPAANMQNAFLNRAPAHSHANSKARRSSGLCEALDQIKGTATSPALTFDLANCAEDNDRPKDAAQLLRSYLEMAPQAADAARVWLRIRDLDALLGLTGATGSQIRSLYAAASRSIEERKFDRALSQFEKAAQHCTRIRADAVEIGADV